MSNRPVRLDQVCATLLAANKDYNHLAGKAREKVRDKKKKALSEAVLARKGGSDETNHIVEQLREVDTVEKRQEIIAALDNPLELFDLIESNDISDKDLENIRTHEHTRLMDFVDGQYGDEQMTSACQRYVKMLPPRLTDFENSLPSISNSEAARIQARNTNGSFATPPTPPAPASATTPAPAPAPASTTTPAPAATTSAVTNDEEEVTPPADRAERGLEGNNKMDVLGLSAKDLRRLVLYKLVHAISTRKAQQELVKMVSTMVKMTCSQ